MKGQVLKSIADLSNACYSVMPLYHVREAAAELVSITGRTTLKAQQLCVPSNVLAVTINSIAAHCSVHTSRLREHNEASRSIVFAVTINAVAARYSVHLASPGAYGIARRSLTQGMG